MSFQAMAWAVKQKVGSATGKMILTMLANRADENGVCYPGQETLAEECECSLRTVREWLAKFEEMGLLRREKRRRDDGYRTSDRMLLRMRDLPPEPNPGISPANAACELSPAEFSPETDRHSYRQQLPGKKQSVGTVRNHNNRVRGRATKSTKSEGTPRQALERVLDPERAAEIVKHRTRIRKPLTFGAASKLADKLAKWPDPNEAADEILANGWQGFDPSWMDRRRTSASTAKAHAAGSLSRKSTNQLFLEELDRQLGDCPGDQTALVIDGHARRN